MVSGRKSGKMIGSGGRGDTKAGWSLERLKLCAGSGFTGFRALSPSENTQRPPARAWPNSSPKPSRSPFAFPSARITEGRVGRPPVEGRDIHPGEIVAGEK